MLRAVPGLIEERHFWSSLGSIVCLHTARNHVHSIARGLTQETSYKIESLNVSVSREAHVGRSGDSDLNAASLHSSRPAA